MAEGRYHRRPMPEDRTRHDVLARIADNPTLARAVPGLRPEVLHALIAHYGLQDCGELLAWPLPHSSRLSSISTSGNPFALARTSSSMPRDFWNGSKCSWMPTRRWPPTAWQPSTPSWSSQAWPPESRSGIRACSKPTNEDERTGADAVLNVGRERGVHAEIGGYLVVARRPDGWTRSRRR